jgi:hypothetical protein
VEGRDHPIPGRDTDGSYEMWTAKSATFRNREVIDTCDHEQISVTTIAGLERTVCGDCGHVSVGYLYDLVETLHPVQPED